MQGLGDNFMCFSGGASNSAGNLRHVNFIGQAGKRHQYVIGWLQGKTPQSMVSPSRRAGVPVFSRPTGRPMPRSRSASFTDGRSPIRPAGVRSVPK